jgi:hypothetical protein
MWDLESEGGGSFTETWWGASILPYAAGSTYELRDDETGDVATVPMHTLRYDANELLGYPEATESDVVFLSEHLIFDVGLQMTSVFKKEGSAWLPSDVDLTEAQGAEEKQGKEEKKEEAVVIGSTRAGEGKRRGGARAKRGGRERSERASEKNGARLRREGARASEKNGALLRRERASDGAVGGRPPEPPPRPARSHMRSAARALGRSAAHALGHMRPLTPPSNSPPSRALPAEYEDFFDAMFASSFASVQSMYSGVSGSSKVRCREGGGGKRRALMMTYKTHVPMTIMRVAGSATSAMRKPQRSKRMRNDEA